MSKYGIFFIPEKTLVDEINSIKNYFLLNSSKNKYLEHPVHSSIYVIDVKKNSEENLIDSFTKLKEQINPTYCKLEGWSVFEKDPLTGGLNTLYLKIEKKLTLFQIQLKVAEALNLFHRKTPISFPFKNEFKSSYDKYGYPFIGNHWIPHVTVGSLSMDLIQINNCIKNFTLNSNKLLINSLCLFHIEKDNHHLIKQINF